MSIFKQIFLLLDSPDKKKAYLLIFLTLIMAMLDTLGVASILPFMALLSDTSLIETNSYLAYAYDFFEFKTPRDFLNSIGLAIFFIFLFSMIFKAFTTFFQLRFISNQVHKIGVRLLKGYLNQNYNWFINKNSSDLSKNIISEVDNVIHGSLSTLINLISQLLVSLAILSLIVYVDPKLAIIIGSTLSLAYLMLYKITARFVLKVGGQRVKSNKKRFISISEIFGSMKEVKLRGLESCVISSFISPSEEYAKHIATSKITAQLPKYFLESFAFGGILLVSLYQISSSANFSSSIPIISLYAFAGYRLMPAMQQIYSSLTEINFNNSALNLLCRDINILKLNEGKTFIKSANPFAFKRNITLENISFSFSKSQKVIKNISLEIKRNEKIGFIGPTGSGKSTLVDILTGLLEPKSGSIKVDNIPLDESSIADFQSFIGYVPQHIYLYDSSIINNIAFGEKDEGIDKDYVEFVSKIANIHEFITSLPGGYNTLTGERGVKLSGGQIQRIGIARALYRKPKILILDEATSALDNKTEKLVMDSIVANSEEITLIMIAHRMSSLKECDRIFSLKEGKIIASGSYAEIIEKK